MKHYSENKPSRPSDDESIEATAAAWLAQRDDVFTPEDERRFARWRAADPRHEAAVARLERAWTALQPLRDFRPGAQLHPDPDLLAGSRTGKIARFPKRALGLAAAAAITLAVGWLALRPTAESPVASTYATTVGGYERVLLADGSVLELNGGTSAEVNFTLTERRVRLARGEAHFTVAKNAARPFFVEAGGVAVRAVGTAFNVRLGSQEIEVLVTEGKVELNKSAIPTAVAGTLLGQPGRSAGGESTLLVANERAVIPAALVARSVLLPPLMVERIAPEAVRETLSWQDPRLVFADTPLAEVVAQFNRRNHVQLVLADPTLATLPVDGSFRAENVEAFVRLLESGRDVAVDRPDQVRIVLRRSK